MPTRLELRTRLKRRLGLGVVSSVEDERLSEAINSGISRAHSDGIPGLARTTMTGSVFGTLALTSVAVVQYSREVTIAGPSLLTTHVAPNDILVVITAAPETHKFLITSVPDATTALIGLEAAQAITGVDTSYILRRSLHLPSSGQVLSILQEGQGMRNGLSVEPELCMTIPYTTGTAKYYDQHYAETASESHISLWPAPSDATDQFVVKQLQTKVRLESDTDSLDYTEEVVDAVLERARDCYLTWSGVANQNDLSASYRALRDTSDALKNSSNSRQIFYKT